MPLPEFNDQGDLPPGIHPATLNEVMTRFGSEGGSRNLNTRRLQHIHELATRTNHLGRFIVFGSYITDKPEPNDVDIILVMDDSFRLAQCPKESLALFDHAVAQARFAASIFWIRPSLLIQESVNDFIAYWQTKRDGSKRGIVEVVK